MTRPALKHAYPQWAPPLSDPWADVEDYSEQVVGSMRIVRNRRRARLLKRRGVPMWYNHRERVWMWFIEFPRELGCCCPSCGWILSVAQVYVARRNFVCPRCEKHKLSEFQTVR